MAKSKKRSKKGRVEEIDGAKMQWQKAKKETKKAEWVICNSDI